MTDDPHGADYRARTRISTADDETLAEAGETCERVPVASLSWLLADGLIAPVTPVEAAAPPVPEPEATPDPSPHRRATDPHDEDPADGR